MKSLTLTGLIVLTSLTLASCTSTTTRNTPAITSPKPSQTATKEEISTSSSSTTMEHNTSTTMEQNHMGATSEEEFIVNMIPHHQEAIDNAKIIIAKSENVELKKIAQAIVDGQSKEVVTLKGWLKNWYPNSNIKKEYMSMMGDLNKLSSHDLDDAFMEGMVKHHEGAVHMAEEVLDVSQRPEIVTLAKNIIKTQNEEIATFKKMLNDH